MAGPRPLVSPPSAVPRSYGLLSVVQPRFEEPDVHWRNGVTWMATCDLAGNTFDDFCVTGEGAPAKAANLTSQNYGATPFTVYAELECSAPGGSTDEERQRVMDKLLEVEPWQVERTFWTGTVAGGSGGYRAYPHLAHASEVTDPQISSIILQMAVDQVTGVALDPVEALGRLEYALGNCIAGQGIIHVTHAVAVALEANYLIMPKGAQMVTASGNLVAIGSGYNGIAPNGSATTGVHWMYATGQIFAYRSSPEYVAATFREMFDRDTNTAKIIAERTYVLGYDCCLHGVPVDLGGIVDGTYNSAT